MCVSSGPTRKFTAAKSNSWRFGPEAFLAAVLQGCLICLTGFPKISILAILFIIVVLVGCFFLYRLLLAFFLKPEEPQHPNRGWHEVKTQEQIDNRAIRIKKREQMRANSKR